MAEFLIMARDNNHSDPEKDKLCYKTGDIVEARPDGSQYGSKECLPAFLKIHVPDMSMYEADCLADSLYDAEGNLRVRRQFFCTQNISIKNQVYFNECVLQNKPYTTTKADFIFYALQERE